MPLSLSPETEKLVESKMRDGGYRSADDVVRAALATLDQMNRAREFAPGEVDRLLAEADAEIERGDVLDGEEVFRELRELGAKRGKAAG